MVYRALYENSLRRHFIGEILGAQGALCRIEGYAFVYDVKTTMFDKRKEKRTTIADLGESGYIVNVLPNDVDIHDIIYKYEGGVGLVATDNKGFSLNINEFGIKS